MLGGKALDDWAQIRDEEMGHMLGAMYDCNKRDEAVVVDEIMWRILKKHIWALKQPRHEEAIDVEQIKRQDFSSSMRKGKCPVENRL